MTDSGECTKVAEQNDRHWPERPEQNVIGTHLGAIDAGAKESVVVLDSAKARKVNGVDGKGARARGRDHEHPGETGQAKGRPTYICNGCARGRSCERITCFTLTPLGSPSQHGTYRQIVSALGDSFGKQFMISATVRWV
jgi:hypothetical protein